MDGQYRNKCIGTAAAANQTGICLCGAFSSTVGGPLGNVISGNTQHGVEPSQQGGGNHIVHNMIGTNATGTAAIPNDVGVYIFESSANMIGGSTPTERNIISGNNVGISVSRDPLGGAFVNANTITGNYIGTDITGTTAIGNSTGVSIGARGIGQVVGGTTSLTPGACTGSCNLISGNVIGVGAGNLGGVNVSNNFIGTDITGTQALPNTAMGVAVTAFAIPGGSNTVEDNLISGNGGDGVFVSGPGIASSGIRSERTWAVRVRSEMTAVACTS